MISKKRRHKGLIHSPPTTGRAAFRGILHPLILGGQSIAPSTNTATPNFDPYSTATVVKPNTDQGEAARIKAPCEMSAAEEKWCDIDPTYSWCEKRMLFADDPKCVPTDLKCSLTQKYLDLFYDPKVAESKYLGFLSEEGVTTGRNGVCLDEQLRKDKEAEANKSLCLIITPPNGVVQRYCPMSDTMKALYVKTNSYGKDKVLSDGTVFNWYAQ